MAEVPICIYPSGYTLSGAEQSRYAAGHRYTSQSAMESGEEGDWVTAGDNPLVEIIGGDATYNWDGNPDTTNVSYNGWTLSSTYYLTVKTIGTARPDYSSGWDSTAYICAKITLGSSNTMYCHFDGIQSTVAGTCLLMADPLVNIEFANCYFKATDDTANNIWVTSTSTATIRMWNCVIENGTHGVKFSSANISMYMYHCIVTDISDDAVECDNFPLYPINCAVFNNLDDWRDPFPTGYPNYCASDDNDWGSNGIDISPGASEPDDWNAAFTDYSNGDFSIKDTDSVLYNAGLDLSNEFTDLTGNTDPLGTDILGNTRSTWDVGPYAWVTSNGLSINVNDAIATTESIGEYIPLKHSVFDSINVIDVITDIIITLLGRSIDVNDAITIAESIGINIYINTDVYDEISVSEFVGMILPVNVDINDAIAVADVVVNLILNLKSLNYDEISLTEFINASLNVRPFLSEEINITEFLNTKIPVRSINSENISVVDVITNIILSTAGVASISKIEEISIEEFIKIGLNSKIGVQENITLADIVNIIIPLSYNVNDSVLIQENVATALYLNFNPYDAISISDIVNVVISTLGYLTFSTYETISVNENIAIFLEIFKELLTVSTPLLREITAYSALLKEKTVETKITKSISVNSKLGGI